MRTLKAFISCIAGGHGRDEQPLGRGSDQGAGLVQNKGQAGNIEKGRASMCASSYLPHFFGSRPRCPCEELPRRLGGHFVGSVVCKRKAAFMQHGAACFFFPVVRSHSVLPHIGKDFLLWLPERVYGQTRVDPCDDRPSMGGDFACPLFPAGLGPCPAARGGRGRVRVHVQTFQVTWPLLFFGTKRSCLGRIMPQSSTHLLYLCLPSVKMMSVCM